jgi:glutathione S-transferase
MSVLILTTFDWVPDMPRGCYVRDLRVRWALEEACLPIASRARPFCSPVIWPSAVADGWGHLDFESGAILLYLGELSDTLFPPSPRAQ